MPYYLFTLCCHCNTFVVAVGSIGKEVQELVHWCMRAILQLWFREEMRVRRKRCGKDRSNETLQTKSVKLYFSVHTEQIWGELLLRVKERERPVKTSFTSGIRICDSDKAILILTTLNLWNLDKLRHNRPFHSSRKQTKSISAYSAPRFPPISQQVSLVVTLDTLVWVNLELGWLDYRLKHKSALIFLKLSKLDLTNLWPHLVNVRLFTSISMWKYSSNILFFDNHLQSQP